MSTLEMARSGQRSDERENAPEDLRVLIRHRDELVLLGCRAVLRRQEWVSHCLLAKGLERAARLAASHRPHLLVLHVGREEAAAEAIAIVRSEAPSMQVVLVTEPGRFSESDARAVGATTTITLPVAASELIALARIVASGGELAKAIPDNGTVLSQRELQVVRRLATGATNREIGIDLVLAPDTIKNHVSRAYRKLGARNRLEAVNRARDLGLIA